MNYLPLPAPWDTFIYPFNSHQTEARASTLAPVSLQLKPCSNTFPFTHTERIWSKKSFILTIEGPEVCSGLNHALLYLTGSQIYAERSWSIPGHIAEFEAWVAVENTKRNDRQWGRDWREWVLWKEERGIFSEMLIGRVFSYTEWKWHSGYKDEVNSGPYTIAAALIYASLAL